MLSEDPTILLAACVLMGLVGLIWVVLLVGAIVETLDEWRQKRRVRRSRG